MPRKNHNAQPIYRPKESWISLLPYQGRIELRKSVGASCRRGNTPLRVTGESIVKEFRREEEVKNDRQPSTVDRRCIPTFQPYRVVPQAHPSFIRRFFNRINWNIALEWACWTAAIIAILTIAGLIIFGPFTVKEFWK